MKTKWGALALAACTSAALGIVAPGCGTTPAPPGPTPPPAPAVGDDRDAIAPVDDPLGDPASKVVYLSQNWSPALSQQFYFTTQGSEILPYDWFLALEQADAATAFRDNQNILKYRYLPQKPDAANPDGLPVGFVKDPGRDRAWLGLSCAACHTAEIHYKGTAYRVDGGPAMADIASFSRALTAALTAIRDTPDKFARFSKALLKDKDGPVAQATLRAQLGKVIDRRSGYDARNFLPGVAGFGRIDAFGAILNEVFHHALPGKALPPMANAVPANAPVSIPFLWDTPQHDLLQWNGSAANGGPGNVGGLARNVGEVLGVFGDFVIPDDPGPFGYSSSVQVRDLMSLESWVETLWSPQWPADFPAIDPAKRDRGRTLYVANCVKCHADIDRASPTRKVKAVMWGTGTDAQMANNFANRVGDSGKLKGSYELFVPLAGQEIPAMSPGALMLRNVVIGVIVGSPFSAPADDLAKIELAGAPKPAASLTAAGTGEVGPRYKGRPLDGIWATAPYLHNGSVPSLADLLKPVKDRPASFSIGSREFDPAAVGFRQDATGVFTFRVDAPGNSNAGHPYGTDLPDDQKADLLEYLKSL